MELYKVKKIICSIFALSGCSIQPESNVKNLSTHEEINDVSDSATESSIPNYVTYDENYATSVETGYNYFSISDRYDKNDNISFEELRNPDDSVENYIHFMN